MATPILFADFDGTLDYENTGSGGTATGTGALRYRDGHRDGVEAAFVEEATTNLWPSDPVMSMSGTTAWSKSANSTLAKNTAWKYTGTQSMRVTVNNLNDSTLYQTVTTLDVGVPHAISAYVFLHTAGSPGGPRSICFAYNSANHAVQEIEAGEERLMSTIITGVASSATGVKIPSARNGDIWFVGGIQIEEKDHATSICPELDASGDLMPGYAWTGTAHQSPATREATTIEIPMLTAPTSLACRYSEDNGATWSFAYLTGFSEGNLGSYSSITHDGDELIIASDRSLLIGPLMAFSDTLTAGELMLLRESPVWDMDLLGPVVGRFIVVGVPGTNPNVPKITLP